VELQETFEWRGRDVRWQRLGSGPAVVFCHGTPWSSLLWAAFADAVSDRFTAYLWDMPGYGQSSKSAEHPVSLDVQGEVLADLIVHWGLQSPHVVAHDYGGVVALRAHLLHGRPFSSLALVDVVALAPWGTPFLQLVRDHLSAFTSIPAHIHEGALRAYIEGASHVGLTPRQLDGLMSPWLGDGGQAAFYKQLSEADETYTDDIQDRYQDLDLPVLVVWGEQDSWLPVEHAHRLAELIPGSELRVIGDAGHLVQYDQPVQLAVTLEHWLTSQR
jgi:pimeloyl-ACP methyl ester carboxylesterase